MSAAAALKPGCAFTIGWQIGELVGGCKFFVAHPAGVKTLETGRILVLGSGYVASSYCRAINFLGYHPLTLSRSWMNYMDMGALRFFLAGYKPSLVINAAGYTGRTVDDCQTHKNECYQANVTLPRNLSLICAEQKIKMIHVSSGCIFNGEGPFTEEDQPNFIRNFYQSCKHSAELDVLRSGAQAWIYRIRMPFDYYPHPRNWLFKLMTYERILEGFNSVTFMGAAAMRSFQLVDKAPPGIYHVVESVPIRTVKVAQMLHRAGLRGPVKRYLPEKFLSDGFVPRSAAVLSAKKFEDAYGSAFGDPLVSLRWCIDRLKEGGALWPHETAPLRPADVAAKWLHDDQHHQTGGSAG